MLVRPAAFLLLPFLSAPLASAQGEPDPNHLSGVITSILSPSAFSVGGTPVELSPGATFGHRVGHATTALHQPPTLFLGESVELTGRPRRRKPFLVDGLRIPTPDPVPVSGAGLIDRAFTPLSPSPEHPQPTQLVLADGYLLRIPSSILQPDAPNPLTPNLLLAYRGTLEPDGSVEVTAAEAVTPVVSKTEAKLRDRFTYDDTTMAAAHTSTPQSRFSRSFHGLDQKRLPAIPEPALQERVARIGQSLIPAAQRNLPASDPNYLAFSFHVVDAPSDIRSVLPMPSGAILLPLKLVERLQVDHPTDAQLDSRLAAALAFSIASVQEKQTIRLCSVREKAGAANIAGLAIGVLVPGAAIATGIGGAAATAHVMQQLQQQADRIALALLHDAGYDLTQAPIASLLLDPKSPKPLSEIKIDSGTLDLFVDLGRLYCPSCLSNTLPPTAQMPPPSAQPTATQPAP